MPRGDRGPATLDAAGKTDTGRERERNEDQFLIATLERRLAVQQTSVDNVNDILPAGDEGTVVLVADGMGGGEAGDVASAVAVRAVADYVCNVMPWATSMAARQRSSMASGTLPGVRSGLQSALVSGDAEVRRVALEGGGGTMGTTVTMAYILWPHVYVAHVGDSRCYLFRHNTLVQLTTDHTLAEKLRQKTNTPISETSPWHHVLWNALGCAENAALEPEVRRVLLRTNDVLLLCSDGLTKHVGDEAITEVLTSTSSAADACEKLVAAANADGGSDNITAAVVRCLPLTRTGNTEILEDEDPTVALE